MLRYQFMQPDFCVNLYGAAGMPAADVAILNPDKRLLLIGQHGDEISHVFGQIAVFPVADVEVPVVLNAQNRIGDAERKQL